MKFIAGTILVFLVIAVSVQGETISQHYNTYLQNKQAGNDNQYDDNCIRNTLQVDKFGDKSLTQFEFDFLFDYSRFYCSEQSAIDYEINSYKFLLMHFGIASDEVAVPCLKKKLLDLEPETNYINVTASNSPSCSFKKFHEGLPMGLRFIYQQNAEDTLKFSKTCSQISFDEYTKIIVKSVLVTIVGFSEEQKDFEQNKVMREFKEFKTAGRNCIVKRLESE